MELCFYELTIIYSIVSQSTEENLYIGLLWAPLSLYRKKWGHFVLSVQPHWDTYVPHIFNESQWDIFVPDCNAIRPNWDFVIPAVCLHVFLLHLYAGLRFRDICVPVGFLNGIYVSQWDFSMGHNVSQWDFSAISQWDKCVPVGFKLSCHSYISVLLSPSGIYMSQKLKF